MHSAREKLNNTSNIAQALSTWLPIKYGITYHEFFDFCEAMKEILYMKNDVKETDSQKRNRIKRLKKEFNKDSIDDILERRLG